jgi:hypothetical protein
VFTKSLKKREWREGEKATLQNNKEIKERNNNTTNYISFLLYKVLFFGAETKINECHRGLKSVRGRKRKERKATHPFRRNTK